MKKFMSKIIAVIFAIIISCSCLSLTACNDEEYTFNYDYLFGLCDPSGSLGGGVDKYITNEWLGDVSEVLGVKSFRLWISLDGRNNGLVNVDSENNVSFNEAYKNKVHGYVNELKRGGVENFLLLPTCFIYPYGSSCVGFDVPDPNENEEEYLGFLEMMEKAFVLIAKEFPEIRNYETGNEPDLDGAGMHKPGYIGGADAATNKDYIYSSDQLAGIIADMSWYCRRGIKSVSEKNKLSLPGLSLAYDPEKEFFESIYTEIESRAYPFGQEYSDIDPDNYFDIIDFHPYCQAGGQNRNYDFDDDVWDEWIESTSLVHDVAVKHGDAEKPHYFSELGWTDWGDDSVQEQIGNDYLIAFEIIRQKMPWVEVVFCFRATTLVDQKVSEAEDNYGIFYNQGDPIRAGRAKPAAKSLAEYFGSGTQDFEGLELKYSKN